MAVLKAFFLDKKLVTVKNNKKLFKKYNNTKWTFLRDIYAFAQQTIIKLQSHHNLPIAPDKVSSNMDNWRKNFSNLRCRY